MDDKNYIVTLLGIRANYTFFTIGDSPQVHMTSFDKPVKEEK